MVRVLAQGMRELGLDPTTAVLAGAGHRGCVPLDDKRALVAAAVAQAGPGCLVLLGRGIHHFTHEPTHRALVAARDAADLLQRWQRLERYIHSRHRVVVQSAHGDGTAGAGQLRLQHVALAGQPAPLPAEDLVVLGVIAALLQACGAQGLRAWVDGCPAWPEPDTARLVALVGAGGAGGGDGGDGGDGGGGAAPGTAPSANWRLRWTGWAPARPTLPRAAPNAVPGPTPAELRPADGWPALAERVFDALAGALLNVPSLPALAQGLGLAPRSLQRELSSAGHSVTTLLGQARQRTAAWWLVHDASLPLAEVGLISGYADQAHFTRDFSAQVGLPPARYRQAFGQGSR
jgi:AraC-like DNA-binding protein